MKLVFSVFEENPHHCYLCNLGGMRQSKSDSVPPRFIFNRLLKSVLRNLPGCNMHPSKSRPIRKEIDKNENDRNRAVCSLLLTDNTHTSKPAKTNHLFIKSSDIQLIIKCQTCEARRVAPKKCVGD